MTFTIYTFGNGDVLFNVFTSIVLMTGAGYESLMRLGLVCLVFGGITYYMARGRVALQLFMGAVLVLFTTVTIKATVQVTDLVNPGVPTRVVGNVPLAVAFPAYMASEVGYQLLTLAETAFATTVPPEYQMMNSTFARGFMDFQKTLGAQLPQSDLQANLTQYLISCVFPSINLGQLQKGTLFTSQDVLTAFAVTNPVLTVVQVVNGNPSTTLVCPDMYHNVVLPGMQDGNPDYDLAMRQLRRALNQPDVLDQELTPVGQFINNIINSTQGARQLINNVLIHERWNNAEMLSAAAGSDTATSIDLMQKQISEDLKTQAFAQSSVAAKFLPMMRTMAESGVYMLTPFVLALAMTPAMFATIRMASMSYAWLLFWAPAYAMVNYLVYAYGNGQVQSLVTAGTGVTLASYTDFYDFLGQMNSFASTIIWGVPSIAAVAMYGMGSAASALMGGTQAAQQAASHEASQVAHGRGEHVDPGRHLEWHDQMSLDAAGHEHHNRYVGGQSGMMIEHQDGSQSIQFSDGAVSTYGRNGMHTYHGPNGYYSENAEGEKVGGVWRDQMLDEQSGQQVMAQHEISGDQEIISYMRTGDDGFEHQITEVHNQHNNDRAYQQDMVKSHGIEETTTTQADGSGTKLWRGTTMVQPSDGEHDIAPGVYNITQSFSRPAPTEENPNPEWIAGDGHIQNATDGHQSYDGHVSFSGGDPDRAHFGFEIEAGDKNSTIAMKNERGGLAVQSVKGVGGEHTYLADGSPKELDFVTKDGRPMTLHHATVRGQGAVDSHGQIQGGTGLVTTSENGFAESHNVQLSYDPQTDRWQAQAVDSSSNARNDHHTSGETLKLKSENGQGSFTLAQGNFDWHGDENDPNTWFDYKGTIIDSQGRAYQGTAMYRDGVLSYSDMRGGMRSEHIGKGGERELIQGDPTSPEGATVTTSSQGFYAYPTGNKNADGVPTVGIHRFTKTATSHRGPDPGDPSKLQDTPIVTQYSGVNKEGAFAVQGRERPIDELDHFALSGETEMWVEGKQETHSSASGPSLTGIPLIEPMAGDVNAQTTRNAIHADGKGHLSAIKETRAPGTNERVVSDTVGVNHEKIEENGGVTDRFTSAHPEHRGQVLSSDSMKRSRVTAPEELNLPGIEGSVWVMTQNDHDPSTGRLIHSSMVNGQDGQVWGAKVLPGGRVEKGTISWHGDGNGHYVYDFTATSKVHVEEGSAEKFAEPPSRGV